MFQLTVVLFTVASYLAIVSAECPNACSAHGKCGAFDMCVCYRNWMSNDCSERICQFGLAHVDSPKGDLDASSGALTGPDTTIIPNSAMYPYGTQEQYPNMVNSDGTVLKNTGHNYMECSNKGICDRETGTCSCFDGYDGSACQRASCPSNDVGVCSGHGTCHSISELAAYDNDNIYKLWDEDITMGCRCDPGYTGADCSERNCKYGPDPLYYTSCYQNIRYSNFTYQFYTKSSSATISGNYSLIFYDSWGEDWQTDPISISADCDAVTDALESLPNNVIPSGTVLCYQHTTTTNANTPIFDSTYMTIGGANTIIPKFTVAFPSNPGRLEQIDINIYLDGTRPTLYSDETSSTLGWHIYANGFTGEDTDYVTDLCAGVLVTLSSSGSTPYTHSLQGLTAAEAKLLKKCLGDSDGDSTNNVEVYNWDYGNFNASVERSVNDGVYFTNQFQNPHLIKLIDATQDVADFTINYGDRIVVTDGDGDSVDITTIYTEDPSLTPYPKTKLCTSESSSINDDYGVGWCANRDPPGFYAVLYYDGSNFNIITRAAADYDSTTNFHVFTTEGYLTRVSPIVEAYSYSSYDSSSYNVDRYHSKKMYLTNSTVPYGTSAEYLGVIDCASNPIGTNAAVECLNKDDYVMFLNVDFTAEGYAANPVYPNLYQVKKIFRAEKDPSLQNVYPELLRNQLIVDYGVNSPYTNLVPAAIYKFTPPTGFNYVGKCSNRGTCNTDTGLCECYPGYTGDNCGQQNALAA